jgi:LPS-assembly protein
LRLSAILLAATLTIGSASAWAQDPSAITSGGGSSSAFGTQPGGMFGATPKVDKTQPLYLQGDQLIYDTKGNRTIARGNVEIFYNNNVLTADEVIYDQGANTLTASGNVELKEANGNVIRADRYTLTDDFRDGFVQSLSVVARDDSRITAERGERREGNVTEFSKATFTACKSEGNMPPLWCIGAKKIIHDQAAATISYQDAQFELFGQPVFYLPYFQHPDPSVKRKSGFLAPFYGSSGELGFMSELPYYFALDPSYDFTFHPRYLSEQGVLWQGDWRQKTANGSYDVKLAAIEQDADKLPSDTTNRDSLDGWRGSLETHGNFSLASWWSYGWDVVLESDDTFRRFYKLDSVLLTDRVNDIYFTGLSDRSYLGVKAYHFGGLLINDTAQSESYVHPIIDHNYVFTDPVLGGELSWDTNLLSFSRSDVDSGINKHEDINRAVTEIKWRRRLTDAIGITYTPFAELRGDVYQLRNYIDPVTGQVVDDETVTRGLATGGATVAYPWVASGAGGSHVIEPIGQIIVRDASVRQRDLPDEDAKSLVFDDTNLFDTTKFSGYDRLETGIRANVGVQYTFQAWSGGHIRVLAGQSYHLQGDNAYADPGFVNPADPNSGFVYSPNSGLETDRSDYVLGLHVAPTDVFRFISQSRFNEHDLSLQREDVTAQFGYGPLSAQVTYAYTATVPELGIAESQQDIIGGLGLRLTDRWTINGAIRYDIDADQRLTDSIGLTYLDECFMLSATYAETFIDDPTRDIEPDRVVMLRFELKHLGGFNYQTNVVDFAGGEDQTTIPH